MAAIINCCRLCVAPKRHPGYHGTCPEYLKEKAVYDARKAIADKEKFTSHGITMQRSQAVCRALKGRKVK